MRERSYVLRSRWVVPAARERLWDVLLAALESDDPLPWWGTVRAVGQGDDGGLRMEVSSGLGYRLAFVLGDLSLDRPSTMAFTAAGDLNGEALLRFIPGGPERTILCVDWRVTAGRAWMRLTDPILRPAFVAAHRRVMRQGERRLAAWLER